MRLAAAFLRDADEITVVAAYRGETSVGALHENFGFRLPLALVGTRNTSGLIPGGAAVRRCLHPESRARRRELNPECEAGIDDDVGARHLDNYYVIGRKRRGSVFNPSSGPTARVFLTAGTILSSDRVFGKLARELSPLLPVVAKRKIEKAWLFGLEEANELFARP